MNVYEPPDTDARDIAAAIRDGRLPAAQREVLADLVLTLDAVVRAIPGTGSVPPEHLANVLGIVLGAYRRVLHAARERQ